VKIYRVTKKEFVKDLTGEGARLYGGRWNKKGRSMLYFSEHLSLCVLEMLTRIDFEFLSEDYAFIEVEIPEKLIASLEKASSVSRKWRTDPPTVATQEFGSKWLASEANVALTVPSSVLPNERNILVNPNHRLISKLKITNSGKLDLDSRVMK